MMSQTRGHFNNNSQEIVCSFSKNSFSERYLKTVNYFKEQNFVGTLKNGGYFCLILYDSKAKISKKTMHIFDCHTLKNNEQPLQPY